jgi:hypothetical protein
VFRFISSWNIIVNESVNISVHFCWSNILLFSQSFMGFWIRSVWKIWNFALFSWKWIYNTCYKSMNLFINSFFTNIWLFFILFFFSKCFVGFWIRSIWKIWNFALFSWKRINNTCYKSMNFFIYSFFTDVWFFFILFIFS